MAFSNTLAMALNFASVKGQQEVSIAVLRERPRQPMQKEATTENEDISASTRQFECQWVDDKKWIIGYLSLMDDKNFSNLGSVITQLNPTTCYVSAQKTKDRQFKKLDIALEGVDVETVSKDRFSSSGFESKLKHFLAVDNLAFIRGTDNKMVMGCVNCLIQNALAGEEISGRGEFEELDVGQFLKLDQAAIAALHLFPVGKSQVSGDQYNSVFGVLNRCVTRGMGSRLLQRWIRQPLLDIRAIRERQVLVQAFAEDPIVRDSVRELLKAIPDLHALMLKMERQAKLENVYRYYTFAAGLPSLISALEETDNDVNRFSHFLEDLRAIKAQLQPLVQMTEMILDFDALDSMPPEFKINPSCELGGQHGLPKLRRDEDDLKDQIKTLYNKCKMSWPGIKDLKYQTEKQFGFVFRTAKKNHKFVMKIPKVSMLKALKSGCIFTTLGPKGLQAIARQLMDVSREYNKCQQIVVNEAVDVGRSYAPVIAKACAVLAKIDVLCSLAHVAVNAPVPYVQPVLSAMGTGDIDIRAARHPCVELQDNTNFIPNDYRMQRDKERFLIVTGPNMGGKSTYIRQLGTLVVMAQIGSFLPCASARLPVMDAVWARVGAGDYQLKGISTFMAEMLEAAAIVKNATRNSLIIIDELGRGTSTYDGFGLAWAIANYAVNKCQSFGFFATHFHELTDMSKTNAGVANYHVSAHTTADSITMMYEVKPGACDESYGIHVAELVKFPQCVIKMAKRKVGHLEHGAAPDTPPASKRQRGLTESKKIEKFLSGFVKTNAHTAKAFVDQFKTTID